MWTEDKLNEMLTTPSAALVEDMKRIKGDIMILGAGGKMGPTLCVLAKRAIERAGISKRVIAVSRFTDPIATALLQESGVETIPCDLLDTAQLRALPGVENVIYMAGRKFGTDGNEWQTWAMNATLPAFVAEKFQKSDIVVFSSGNIYPLVPIAGGGSRECDPVGPIGEYPMSCLARERAFEFAAHRYGTKIFIYRLNFAVDLRYGVLYDMADKILRGEAIDLSTPCLNCIWQGSANEIALRGLLHAENPAKVMNVTGPETLSVRATAQELGKHLGKEPIFSGSDGTDAYLNNASAAMELFGYPAVGAKTLIRWQAEWIQDGGRSLGKPTHFEERKGSY
ncbi:MAG: NAD(P)-dependent oxidoreductase [Ruminococcaceae bacterium]|nr:NAD(P)-dependent oxidoreductase [Oscillospiraceae bacterium]